MARDEVAPESLQVAQSTHNDRTTDIKDVTSIKRTSPLEPKDSLHKRSCEYVREDVTYTWGA